MSNDEIIAIFREEARDHLGALENSFLDLERTESLEIRRGLIDNAFRHAHSLKSDAKVVGLPDLKTAAQALEDILDELRDHPETADSRAINRGLVGFDRVREAYEKWQRDTEPVSKISTGLDPGSSVLRAAHASDSHSASKPLAEPREPSRAIVELSSSATSAPVHAEERFTVRVPSERLDRMLNLAGELGISQQASEEVFRQLFGLREVLEFLNREPEEFLESPASHLDGLLDRVRRIEGDLRKKRGKEALITDSLETSIRQARLLPLVMLADSLRRTVRDLAQSQNKPIAYNAEVGSILLDKAVIEALKNPLVHMIRNAVDHGIESAEDRTAKGKPAEGSIMMTATCRGQKVRITLSDDGSGVRFPEIRERLAEMGEFTPAEIAALSDNELARSLFKAGFSTAPPGELSGRGVGLDVVRDTMCRLNGHVELVSSSPAGTTFALTVPVTVSTIRILTVVCGGQCYGVPTTSVIATGRAKREELFDLGGHLVLPVKGQPVRWISLSEMVEKPASASLQNDRIWSYLLVSGNEQTLAVAVDDLKEESEVLLKPLGFPLAGMPGIVGAAIRADGSIQLVLDPTDSALTKVPESHERWHLETRPLGRLMVVDDSPMTRAVLRNVFTAAGYSVLTATDGIDALEKLAVQSVDVVISDVEMPRLNGFDLTRQLKSKYGVPVVLVTGREREEHRMEGLESGADAYVVKSTFEDRGLLEIVEQFV